MDKNLLQLNYSFYNVCAKLIKQSTFEIDMENAKSLKKYLYICGKIADLLRQQFKGSSFCSNYRLHLRLACLID